MKQISSSEFENEVILKKGVVVVDFFSTECPPCDALAPKFESLAKLYEGHAEFVKIFRQENRELAASLGVSSSPSVLFYKDGKRVGDLLSGGIKRSELLRNLEPLFSKEIIFGINSQIKPVTTLCETIILGAGPAGLTAGIYLAQAKVDTILIDIAMPGGQVSTTHLVSNYPGFEEPVNGYMLSHHITEQCRKAGVKFRLAVDVTKVDLIKKEIVIDAVETIKAKKIIISTGASPRYLNVEGEKEFMGKGISYCATCDAKYFHDKEVIIIGGGNTAVEESEFISKFASKIKMFQNLEKLTANKEACEKLYTNQKISVEYNAEPRSFEKVGNRMCVLYENNKTGAIQKFEADGIFVFVGMKPNLDLIQDKLDLDPWGYVMTDEDMHTNIPDVFAVGDVISKKYRQITTAVSDGTIAAIVVAKELE